MIDNLIQKMLATYLRKAIAGACAVWITLLVDKGVATQSDISLFIQVGVAILIFVGNALWTQLKNKAQDKVAVTVPANSLELVKSAVAITSPAGYPSKGQAAIGAENDKMEGL